MKFLVGYSNDSSGKDALKLGVALTEMTQGKLIVCHIVAKTWHNIALAKFDEDYDQFLCDEAQKALDDAKLTVPSHIEARYIARTALSISEGLKQTAKELSVDCMVISGARIAIKGQFFSGTVADELLNQLSLPVALAPKGFAKNQGFTSPLTRLSCAVSGSDQSCNLAVSAGEWAEIFNVPLRFVTFAVRDRDITPTAAGFDAENMVINEWREQIEAEYAQATQHWESDLPISLEIGDGPTWKESIQSIDWQASELLIVGTTTSGIFKQVLVGKNAEKIIRYASVPRLVLPRSID
ncbi:universal stress protein [Acinetobacter baylyi]|uniref:universal stress protein n=1 Tax=Acinetobacter baylyi TaxID=202950 RepID=UPI000EA0A486|nr:universal stress protein [Acinetobacter baylyi]